MPSCIALTRVRPPVVPWQATAATRGWGGNDLPRATGTPLVDRSTRSVSVRAHACASVLGERLRVLVSTLQLRPHALAHRAHPLRRAARRLDRVSGPVSNR